MAAIRLLLLLDKLAREGTLHMLAAYEDEEPYAVPANSQAVRDLTNAARGLGYRPQDRIR